MDCRLAHIPGSVADVHAFSLKAVGKGIGHGVAKGAQLLFQLLLHLFSLVFLCCIVFTMIHQYFSPFCRCIPADDRTGDPQAVHGGAHNAARISGPLAAGVQPRQLGRF